MSTGEVKDAFNLAMDKREGFSIREYVSRMRSINVVKCCPFDETPTEESVKSLLPPITVKKFIWWMDELQYLGSESPNIEDRKKLNKKVLEKGESSLRSEDKLKDSDSDVGEAIEAINVNFSKSKAKAPKKRPISEIFAAAPLVERVCTDEEDDSFQEVGELRIKSNLSRSQGMNWDFKGKRNEKKRKKNKIKKNKETISSKLKKATKVINKIKKTTSSQKGHDKMDVSFQNKKPQDQDKTIKSQNSICTPENENDFPHHVSIQEQNSVKNLRVCKTLKSITNPASPKPGVLKNNTKACSMLQPTMCILEDTSQVNHNGRQKGEKHVTFVEKVLTQRRKSFFSLESFEPQRYSASDLCEANCLGSVGNDSSMAKTSESEDSRLASKVQSCSIYRSTFMQQYNKVELLSESATADRTKDDKAQYLSDICHCETPQDPYFAFPSKLNVKVITNTSSSTSPMLIKDFGASAATLPVCCKDDQNILKEQSVSNLTDMGKSRKKLPHASSQLNDSQLVQDEAFSHLSARGLLQSICSPTNEYHAEHSCIKRIGIPEDLVGLPLNSRGELLAMKSNNKDHLKEMVNLHATSTHCISLSLPSNTLTKCFSKCSVEKTWDCITSSRNHSSLFLSEGHLKESPVAFAPTKLDMNGHQCTGKTSVHLDMIKIDDHSFHSQNSLCKKNKVPDTHANEKILSTMRLMGKEFIVGGRGFQEFEDGPMWNNKQIIDELHFSNTSTANVMHNQDGPFSRKLGETLFCPLELTVNHSSPGLNSLSHFYKSYHALPHGSVSAVFHSKSSFLKPFSSGYESHWDPHPNVGSSDINLSRIQDPSQTSRSAITFPFVHSDLDCQVQSYGSQGSHMNGSPLSFDISDNGTWLSNFHLRHDLGNSRHPCLMPRTNKWRDSSLPLNSETSCAYSPFSISSTLQNPVEASSSPTLFAQQSPNLFGPGV